MNTNEATVIFALEGKSISFDELTKFLCIEPTSMISRGSEKITKKPRMMSWQIAGERIVGEYIDIYAMATEVINIVKPKKEKIIQAKTRFGVLPRLDVVLWVGTHESISAPAIGFDFDTVGFLGEIGAFIDVDTYKH